MISSAFVLLLIVVGLSYIYAFVTGFTDASNLIATTVSSRAMQPRHALYMASFMQLIGALSGTAVALTITNKITTPTQITLGVVAGAVFATIAWSIITYFFGLPVSETHSLIGAIIGATIANGGLWSVQWSTVGISVAAILTSAVLGFSGAFLLLKFIYLIFKRFQNRWVKRLFKYLQIGSAAFMSYSHGQNDAQKPMGMVALAVGVYAGVTQNQIALWIIVSVALTKSAGMLLGGFKILQKIGLRMTKLNYEQGFASQFAAAVCLETANFFGIPVSTSQTGTAALVGAGVAKRRSSVNWGVFGEILISWILTLPATILIGFLITSFVGLF
ncbi:MAG: inorganic phosphate transporter [Patescibacteria group bacterium]